MYIHILGCTYIFSKEKYMCMCVLLLIPICILPLAKLQLSRQDTELQSVDYQFFHYTEKRKNNLGHSMFRSWACCLGVFVQDTQHAGMLAVTHQLTNFYCLIGEILWLLLSWINEILLFVGKKSICMNWWINGVGTAKAKNQFHQTPKPTTP